LEETIAAFDTLVRDGKILSWGVSNFDVADSTSGGDCGRGASGLQSGAVATCRNAPSSMRCCPGAKNRELRWVAYTPFGQSKTAFDARTAQGTVLAEIAEAHQATPRQVALRFLLRHPEVFVIPKASRLAHVAENAAAANLELSAAELGQNRRGFSARKTAPRTATL